MKLSEKIYLEGKSYFYFPYKVHYLKNESEIDKVIISVPKKKFKRAVKRNLIRRRIKEALRINRPLFENIEGYHLFIVYVAKEIMDYDKISETLRETLVKVS